ncbi:cytochrome-c peroxidase [Patiriisocius marinus]|uniref:Cytochrome-c peroxidase n=1 Tax=Patiriisocius marinus TaxID=1397112 RepID=A0A5J4IZB8_9FLAO|nr:cytochrome c peroxidase [Patiriisocius marinus]GER60414.1 cytochrome-c peroxidase [Patiriisocius marinus]
MNFSISTPRSIKWSFLALIIFLLFASCDKLDTYVVKTDTFNSFLNEVELAAIILDESAAAFQLQKIPIDTLKTHILDTRNAYKKVEFFLAYYNPDFVNSHLNGAPLLKIQKSGSEPSVIPPEGLQVLDELIFSETPKNERVKISALAKKFKANVSILTAAMQKVTPSLTDIVNASRIQLVRVFTLGVTGFDTPGSVNALTEAKISLSGMKQLIEGVPEFDKVSQLNQSIQLIDGAINMLSNSSFEEFDRLSFLKEYIDPLYKQLGALPIDKKSVLLSNSSSWNPESTSIFSANFLDPYYFTQLNEKEDSETLRNLGEKLFYDTILSEDGSMSCASCHKPNLAFTDGEIKSISSIEGATVMRNSPTLLNAVFAERYFYDVRAFSLEQQAEHVIFNPKEFNTRYSSLLNRLNNNADYSNDFKVQFGTNKISREQFASALTSYVLSLQSHNSEFDQFVRGELNEIEDEVKNGFNLFMGKAACATCHFAPTFSGLVPPLFVDSETEILGVLSNPLGKDPLLDLDEGRWDNKIANEKSFIYNKSFKTTTVRNIALTAPYFHNGAYSSLEQVLDFYNKGGGAGMGLNVTNQTLPDSELDLSDKEIDDIISFLNSLTEIY